MTQLALCQLESAEDFPYQHTAHAGSSAGSKWHKLQHASVVKLVDTRDLGSRVEKRVGSNPTRRTIYR